MAARRNICVKRYDGSVWQGSAPADYSPDAPDTRRNSIQVAPDGSLWRQLDGYSDPDAEWGLARFDGTEWRYYLTGRNVLGVDIAPDGSVWSVASDKAMYDAQGDYDEDLGYDLYVITPEAVARAQDGTVSGATQTFIGEGEYYMRAMPSVVPGAIAVMGLGASRL